MSAAPALAPRARAVESGCVLVVDDDDGMRETVVEILSSAGMVVEGVGSAAAAQLKQAELTPAVALVDHRLPDATGIELGALFKRRDADLSVVLVTGYASLDNAIAAVWELDGYLTKPVPPTELVRVARAGLERARLRRENRSLAAELRQANLELEQSVAARTRELRGLLAMSEALAGSTRLDEVIDACLRTVTEVTKPDHAGVYLRETETSELVLRARTGQAPWPDLLDGSFDGSRSEGVEKVVSLTAGGGEVGALVLSTAEPIEPMFLTTLASSAAIAIQNVQRLAREQETIDRLSELSRLKSTFLAFVTHELRNPLAGVIGYAELLRKRLETASHERQLEMIEAIIESGGNLRTLIDDLLDVTRAEFIGFRMTLDNVDARKVIARIERLFAAATNPVLTRIAPDLPDVHSNEARLEQVLSNLVANAAKHSPPGAPVEIRAEAEGDHVRLAVIDSGRGIAPEFLPHLFELFTQAGETGRGRADGLGLGLYIVRELVEAMTGTVEAHSQLGHGSEFVVRLRRAGGQ